MFQVRLIEIMELIHRIFELLSNVLCDPLQTSLCSYAETSDSNFDVEYDSSHSRSNPMWQFHYRQTSRWSIAELCVPFVNRLLLGDDAITNSMKYNLFRPWGSNVIGGRKRSTVMEGDSLHRNTNLIVQSCECAIYKTAANSMQLCWATGRMESLAFAFQ